MTAGEVLRRAGALLRSPLPHIWACCEYELGPYCVRCACSKAKSQLDHDAGIELSLFECLSGHIFESDGPLVEAVRFVRAAEDGRAIDRTVPLSEGVASALIAAALEGFVSQNSTRSENLLR